MQNNAGKRLWLTAGTITGLTLGFLLGAAVYAGHVPLVRSAAGMLAPVGTLWLNAIRMTVFPLVVAQLVGSLARKSDVSVARVGTLTVAAVVTMLVVAGVATLLVTPAILTALPWDPEAMAALRSLSANALPPRAAPAAAGSWYMNLVPANPLRAAVQDDLLGVMVFAIAFGIAVRGMASERRSLVVELCQLVSDAMMTIIGWVLWLMPVIAFVFALSLGMASGVGGAQILALFVAACCALLLVFTALLYPMGAFGARMPIGRFASMVLPAQLVGFSTRSSVASLPSMMECAGSGLRLRPEVSGLVLPVAVSSFRLSRVITPPFHFFFLAHVYGIQLSTAQMVTFAFAALVLSFSSLGIPNGGSLMRSAPLYVAAGIPLEAYLITESVDAIPDLFKTVLNVTGLLTVAALVNRHADIRSGRPAMAPAI